MENTEWTWHWNAEHAGNLFQDKARGKSSTPQPHSPNSTLSWGTLLSAVRIRGRKVQSYLWASIRPWHVKALLDQLHLLPNNSKAWSIGKAGCHFISLPRISVFEENSISLFWYQLDIKASILYQHFWTPAKLQVLHLITRQVPQIARFDAVWNLNLMVWFPRMPIGWMKNDVKTETLILKGQTA